MDKLCHDDPRYIHFKNLFTGYVGYSLHVSGLLIFMFYSVDSSSYPPFSGFLALLALAIYTGVTVTFFGKRFLDWRFSWSYIIGWVAIILAFAAGIDCIYLCILFIYFYVN